MNNKLRIFLGMSSVLLLPFSAGTVQAAYHADSDTGVNALDYIEDEHRTKRENQLTEEKKQLLKDAAAMEKHLKQPLDTNKPAPVAFEGDDLTYDERDGSFIARGKVNILQMDAHKFQGEEIRGNLQKHEVEFPGKAHVLQMTPGQLRVTLDGYKGQYNYEKKTGFLENAKGKAGAHYITAKRFEFYPDHIVAYDGTETKCGAKKPDYHLSADKITIYPNQKTIMENVKFWLKNTVILKRKHYEADTSPGAREVNYPRIGYNSDDKLYLNWHLTFPAWQNINTHANILVTGENGWRSNYDVTWANQGMETRLVYGHFEDSDENWIKKEPSLLWKYQHNIGRTHFIYDMNYEFGRWYGSGIHSNHTEYGYGLGYDPIKFHRYTLYMHISHGKTKESYDDSQVTGLSSDIVLTKDFDERWAAYTGYHYSKKDRANSLFSYDTDDYSKKLESGFSYRLDAHNRLVIGTKYSLDKSEWKDIDYYWYHDLHCSEVILRYRSKQNHWNIRWQFTPW